MDMATRLQATSRRFCFRRHDDEAPAAVADPHRNEAAARLRATAAAGAQTEDRRQRIRDATRC
jgi:hypothetical protein